MLEGLLSAGLSLESIGERVGRHPSTVAYWLDHHGLEAVNRERHAPRRTKRLEINAKGVSLSIDTLRMEARKCVLLCSNCHAEVEDGLVSAPGIVAAAGT